MYRYSHTIGMLSLTGRGFSNPLDLGIDRSGLLYVINRSNFHQQTISVRVSVCSAEGEFLHQFSDFGAADGSLIWPTAIAVDENDAVYIADEHKNEIQVFHTDGTYEYKWDGAGPGHDQLERPAGLAVTPDGAILVSDQSHDKVHKFTAEGKCLWEAGGRGHGVAELEQPWGVASDADGYVYVADWGNDRVQAYDPDGRHVRSFGTPGAGAAQLRRPASVAADSGRLYVADWGNDRVRVLAADGTAVATLYGDAGLSLRAREWVAENPGAQQARQHADAAAERRFWGPTAVRVDEQGCVYVVDSCRHRIQVYRRAG